MVQAIMTGTASGVMLFGKDAQEDLEPDIWEMPVLTGKF
jgi:hypothetical protein